MISEKLVQIKKQLKKERVIRKFAREKGEGPSQPRRSHILRGIIKKTKFKQTGVINIEDEETITEEDFDEEVPEIDPAQQENYNHIETLRGELQNLETELLAHQSLKLIC